MMYVMMVFVDGRAAHHSTRPSQRTRDGEEKP